MAGRESADANVPPGRSGGQGRTDRDEMSIERRHRLRMTAEGFLYEEAELLDDRRILDWHKRMITDDIDYRVPIRTTRERSADTEFSDESFFLKEDWGSLKVRCERVENDFAWSEDPPSRNRRLVSNVRVRSYDPEPAELEVANNQFIRREHGDDTEPDLLSMTRFDTLREVENGWRLARRQVLLDHTVLGTPSLSIIL